MQTAILLFLLQGQGVVGPADSARPAYGHTIPVPTVAAARAERPPVLDGALDDPSWSRAEVISGFVQALPTEGAASSERTEVRVLYDDEALYIGARMFERDPSRIVARLTRRDETNVGDQLIIDLDTYHDHRTSMRFFLNPLGVRADGITANDESYADRSWDPVWEAATRTDSLGWTAEMRIPLSQLRFPRRRDQVWGINLVRYLESRQETAVFVLVRQNERGHASRFAHLVGIRDIPAPRRLELMPYVRTALTTDAAAPGDPFFDGTETDVGYGIDLKYGVTSNLTLDATVNPDFGQVEADPAQLNLSVFETFFSERRPFFIEGAQLFDASNACQVLNLCFGAFPQYFYSRRIGRAPSLGASVDPLLGMGETVEIVETFTDAPSATPIRAAAKLTGKLGTGTSLGIMHAATAPTRAAVFGVVDIIAGADTTREQLHYRELVEPAAHFTVGRVQQDVRDGATSFGVLATHTWRDLDAPRLDAALNEQALAASFDWQHRWSNNRFRFGGQLGASRIQGSPDAILRAQRSSARYFDRPDADHVEIDSTRTTLTGASGSAGLGYNGSGGLVVGLGTSYVSPGFETNDLGFMGVADLLSSWLHLGWNRPSPGKRVRHGGVDFALMREWNTDWTRLEDWIGLGGFVGLQNNWNASAFLSYELDGLDRFATRGGPLIVSPANLGLSYFIGSDSRRRVSFTLSGFGEGDAAGGRDGYVSLNIHVRPRTNVQASIGPTLGYSKTAAFFVDAVSDPAATATYDTRYVFARTRETNLGITTRVNYTFSPELSFQLYLQPFTASADYESFAELLRPHSFAFRRYGTAGSTIDDEVTAAGSRGEAPAAGCEKVGDCYRLDPDGGEAGNSFVVQNPDVSFQSLRGTAVLRWEYRPGATLFAVWTQERGAFERRGEFGGLGDVGALFGLHPRNVFLIKGSYWFSR